MTCLKTLLKLYKFIPKAGGLNIAEVVSFVTLVGISCSLKSVALSHVGLRKLTEELAIYLHFIPMVIYYYFSYTRFSVPVYFCFIMLITRLDNIPHVHSIRYKSVLLIICLFVFCLYLPFIK